MYCTDFARKFQACVASVSVGEHARFSMFWLHKKWGKIKRVEGKGGGRIWFPSTSPLFLSTQDRIFEKQRGPT